MKNHRRVPELKARNLQNNLLSIKPKIFSTYVFNFKKKVLWIYIYLILLF